MFLARSYENLLHVYLGLFNLYCSSSPTDVRSPVIVKKDLAVTKASSNDASSAAAITV